MTFQKKNIYKSDGFSAKNIIKMAKYKIVHNKKDCIGCGACAAVTPEHWEMDDEGMAQLKGSQKNGENWEKNIDTEEDCASNQEAADVCPVQIIKVEKV